MKKLKKGEKISQLTWYQARARGFSQKEYNRRIRISSQLKLYHQSGMTKKERIRYKKRNIKKAKKKPTQRVRRQIVLNYRGEKDPYYISLRVLTTDPTATNEAMKIALYELREYFQGVVISTQDFRAGMQEIRNPKNPMKSKFLNKGKYRDPVTINFKQMRKDNDFPIGWEKELIPINEDKHLDQHFLYYELIINGIKVREGGYN